jgi:gluconolactonase
VVAGACFTLAPGHDAWVQRKQPLRQFELKAESPKFWELFDQNAAIEKVAGDFGFTEGPVWASGFLYVSDEVQNRIFRVFPDGRKQEVLSVGGMRQEGAL